MHEISVSATAPKRQQRIFLIYFKVYLRIRILYSARSRNISKNTKSKRKNRMQKTCPKTIFFLLSDCQQTTPLKDGSTVLPTAHIYTLSVQLDFVIVFILWKVNAQQKRVAIFAVLYLTTSELENFIKFQTKIWNHHHPLCAAAEARDTCVSCVMLRRGNMNEEILRLRLQRITTKLKTANKKGYVPENVNENKNGSNRQCCKAL